jgi:hypothetical protein
MKVNMGGFDRILRIVLAAVVATLLFLKQITGTAAIVLGIIAVIFFVTGAVGFCGLYVALGISSKKHAQRGGPTRLDV